MGAVSSVEVSSLEVFAGGLGFRMNSLRSSLATASSSSGFRLVGAGAGCCCCCLVKAERCCCCC
jgi:hypothetical protein